MTPRPEDDNRPEPDMPPESTGRESINRESPDDQGGLTPAELEMDEPLDPSSGATPVAREPSQNDREAQDPK